MASAGLIKELFEEITCSICLQFFDDPVILACGHNFCQTCLTQHWDSSCMEASCPQCRVKDQRNGFRPNRQLANVVEHIKKLELWDHQGPFCMMCDRSEDHQDHSVAPAGKASQEHEISSNKASRYLKMDMPKLIEHCQKKGLKSEGLSVEELRLLLIQRLELEAEEEVGAREKHQSQAQDKMHKEQLTAQAKQQKYERERLQMRKKQPGKDTLGAFTPFSPGENPEDFFSAFERTAQVQGVLVDEYMEYLPSLMRGELRELYHKMPNRGSVTYKAFKEAVFKQFHLVPDYFRQVFRTLRPQPGESFLEFGVKLDAALKNWLDGMNADSREQAHNVMAVDQFCLRLPSDIKYLVKAKAPKDVLQAADIADQLMPNRGSLERQPPHSEKGGKGLQKGGRKEAPPKRGKESQPAEYKVTPILATGSNFKGQACYHCGEVGHRKRNCPQLAAPIPTPVYSVTAFCVKENNEMKYGFREMVRLGDRQVLAVISTGSEVSLVHGDLVSPSDIVPGKSFIIESFGKRCTVPVALLSVEWRQPRRLAEVGVMEMLFAPMIVGRDLMDNEILVAVLNEYFSQAAEMDGTHTDMEREAQSKQVSARLGSGPGTKAVDGRKGENWAPGVMTADLLEEEEEAWLPPELAEFGPITSALDLPEGFSFFGIDDDDEPSQGFLHFYRQAAFCDM